MTDVWHGEILLSDGESIKDIGFSTQNVTSSPALTAPSLRFLSTVDPARIPLYLASGPSYDVWTTSEASEAWFESILLSQPAPAATTDGNGTHEWWTLARAQSPIGILAEVQGQTDILKPRVTQVLFYGTIAAAPAAEGLPTPHSSQDAPNAPPGSLPELCVHALPLSSDLLYQSAASAVVPPSPTTETTEFEAQYLPPVREPSAALKSPKRKRDLFEEATLARRKAKGRGGVGVAAAAAAVAHHGESQHPYASRKSISTDAKPSPLPDSRPSSAHGALPRPASRPLSRSPSISSDIRPLSRRDTAETNGRRSLLSRVDTISSPQPEEPTTESRNKEALTKVVLAAMRMHGLQQRRKGKQRAPGLDDSQPATDQVTAEDDAAKDEEYKQIYHQTYRGAALALRNHISSAPLHAQPDRLRDLVEQFLTLFLTDPLAERPPSVEAQPAQPAGSTPAGGTKTPGGFRAADRGGVFDLPSGMRRPPIARAQTDGSVYVCTGSPVSKRKGERARGEEV